MLNDLNLDELRKNRRIGYYFRYPLHHNNFRTLTVRGHSLGYYTAKPLYGRLTTEGRVDKSAGFNGDIAILFVPPGAKTSEDVEVFVAHTQPENIQLDNGKRNWKKINEIAATYLADNYAENNL